MFFKDLGEVILYLIGFPLFAFSAYEMVDGFIQVVSDLADWARWK